MPSDAEMLATLDRCIERQKAVTAYYKWSLKRRASHIPNRMNSKTFMQSLNNEQKAYMRDRSGRLGGRVFLVGNLMFAGALAAVDWRVALGYLGVVTMFVSGLFFLAKSQIK